jgi:hypothetical protein
MIGTPKQRAARQLWLAERHLRRAARIMARADDRERAGSYSSLASVCALGADTLTREATLPCSL